MQKLQVNLGNRGYQIKIGSGCLSTICDELVSEFTASRYCIVADDIVAKLYGNNLLEDLRNHGLICDMLTFPHGEAHKNLNTIGILASKAAQCGLDRKSMFIALGGGVTGDITGFLASAYLRGIPFIQIPTTLLAQVDSSVGGKTGVDIPEGKNLFGAFYQPQVVYIDINVLKTLPVEEYLSGLAEVIKYGFIREKDFLTFLDSHRQKLMNLDHDAVIEMIYTCCRIKIEIVSEDEKESDMRRILNFGHTIGHAVEAASRFSISHGFSVAIGMIAAARIAVRKEMFAKDDYAKMYELLKKYGLPTEIPEQLDRKLIKSYLLTDKKIVSGKISYILQTGMGSVVITDDVSEYDVDSVLNVTQS